MMIIFGTKIYKNDDVCELVNMIHRIVTITNELKQLVVNKQCLQRADHKSQVLTGNNKIHICLSMSCCYEYEQPRLGVSHCYSLVPHTRDEAEGGPW